jgi:carboxypeptidase PM20D1
VGGLQGAAQIAGRLQASGLQLEALLDEGGVIIPGVIPGIDGPTAVVGVTEKGYLTLELLVEGRGGHSSMPPPHTAIGVLSRALTRLEANPFPVHMDMVMDMFRSLGPYLPLGMRAAFANQWLFGPALRKRLTSAARTNALVRTTTAVTMIQGGVKDNLLPAQARAMVNFRLLPGDRAADVEQYARKIVADDAVQFNIPIGASWEASPVSPLGSPAGQTLLRTIGEVYPEALMAPYLVAGATDARHYVNLCPNVYRFSPMMVSTEDLGSIHANNKRIAISSLERMVQFYILLTMAWTGKKA